jgi:hypothetical protein
MWDHHRPVLFRPVCLPSKGLAQARSGLELAPLHAKGLRRFCRAVAPHMVPASDNARSGS